MLRKKYPYIPSYCKKKKKNKKKLCATLQSVSVFNVFYMSQYEKRALCESQSPRSACTFEQYDQSRHSFTESPDAVENTHEQRRP